MRNSEMTSETWGEAFEHDTDLHNGISAPALKLRTSHKLLFRKVPDNSRVRTFLCTVYVDNHKSHRTDELDNRAERVSCGDRWI